MPSNPGETMNLENDNYVVQPTGSPAHNCYVQELIKRHLDIAVLCVIRNNSMSGQDIAKEIFYKHQVYVSPSAIYSLLYSLKNQDILEIDTVKGDLRTKCYVPTEKGKQIITKQLQEFREALMYFLLQINKNLP